TKKKKPKTSTKKKTKNAQLKKTKEIKRIKQKEKIKILGINPTPIATPANEINGILLSEYLKPKR
ncbi:MAG: hypothetical protein GY822_16560, partial [Deltaproteobacteria bacterium]|nr:hypothetical protein [Deltaproteobacteria bacterium]